MSAIQWRPVPEPVVRRLRSLSRLDNSGFTTKELEKEWGSYDNCFADMVNALVATVE